MDGPVWLDNMRLDNAAYLPRYLVAKKLFMIPLEWNQKEYINKMWLYNNTSKPWVSYDIPIQNMGEVA